MVGRTPGPPGTPSSRSFFEESGACHHRRAGTRALASQGAGSGPGGPPIMQVCVRGKTKWHWASARLVAKTAKVRLLLSYSCVPAKQFQRASARKNRRVTSPPQGVIPPYGALPQIVHTRLRGKARGIRTARRSLTSKLLTPHEALLPARAVFRSPRSLPSTSAAPESGPSQYGDSVATSFATVIPACRNDRRNSQTGRVEGSLFHSHFYPTMKF
jgi:hypothetical protein